jgi:hypothetical protein
LKMHGMWLDYKETKGPLCKMAGIFWFQIYFSIGNRMDQVHGLWTAQGRLVHGSTVDSIVAGSQGSPELDLAAALGHGNLPW